MIAFRARARSNSAPETELWLSQTKEKKKSLALGESHFFGHIKHRGQNNSCRILTAFIHMDPKHIPKLYCSLQMLNGPQRKKPTKKKHFVLQISHAASVPDVFSAIRCWLLPRNTELMSLFRGLQGRLPRAGSEGQRVGSREGSHCGGRPGRGLSGCDGHHEGLRLF